ncbi:hypothetical protein NMY22_g5664 [Coprinellus aureogranulatus]|nr:hypothetical protein NMY22_g5664 [Coprinellus aureogranulatus]
MQDVDPQGVLSEFPKELVYHILDEGVRMSTGFAYTMCLVAQWARAMALPHLYSCAVLKTISKSNKFSECLKDSFLINGGSDIFDPKDHLRGIWVEPASSRVVDIFRLGDKLSNLALSVDNFEWLINGSVRLPVQRRMIPPRCFNVKPPIRLLLFNEAHHDSRWTFAPGILDSETDKSPLFKKITHIQLSEPLCRENMGLNLRHYTGLSHLAVPYRPGDLETSVDTFVQDFLSNSSVETLVLVVYADVLSEAEQDEALKEIKQFGKDRPGNIQYAVCKRQHLQRDWEYEQRGGASIWDRAQSAFNPV